MKKIIVAMMSYKGGVGKTTLAIILAQITLFVQSRRVLGVDLDPQHNFLYGIRPMENYFKDILRTQEDIGTDDLEAKEDWIILDCPVGLGETAKKALAFADIVLVPVRPDFFSLANLDKFFSFAEEQGKKREQLALIKVGYDTTRLSQMAEAALADKGYPIAGRIPLHRLIPYNITKGRIWSTGLSADFRDPYSQLYEKVLHAHQRIADGNFQGIW